MEGEILRGASGLMSLEVHRTQNRLAFLLSTEHLGSFCLEEKKRSQSSEDFYIFVIYLFSYLVNF